MNYSTQKQFKFHRFSAASHVMSAAILSFAAFHAQAAGVDADEYASLMKEANASGFVRVLVSLDEQASLKAIKDDTPGFASRMDRKSQALRAELGPSAMGVGGWSNGLGQSGIYVSAAGLEVLKSSSNATMFMRDITDKFRVKAYGGDGSLDAVEAALRAKSHVEVEVFLNSDEAQYEIGSDGKTKFKAAPGLSTEIDARMNSLASQPFSRGLLSVDRRPVVDGSPSFKARIDREAYIGLRESADVRAIRPIGFSDRRAAQWDTDALKTADLEGGAEVVITLRGSSIFSPKSGFMSPRSWQHQSDVNQAAIGQILADAGSPLTARVNSYAEIGAVHVRLSAAVLRILYAKADSRILRVSLNKPSAWPALTNSTGLINMQSAWNAGFNGDGQHIVILDSGVRKDHEMFKVGGVTKVLHEACFGSNSGGFTSICPAANQLGDSPLNYPGAGEPNANLTYCAALPHSDCSHGTHVAGIAAGHRSSSVSSANLQGVAPNASLAAVQVYSYNATGLVTAFGADVLAALNAVYVAGTTVGTNNPFVVNMSMGGDVYSADCPSIYPDVTNIISNLTSRGVPVVVATGNDGSRNGIAWPACVPQAIKVSSVANDAAGTSLAGFANIGMPANFTGPIFLAPGGSSTTTITSADRASTTSTKAMRGTSQAAPHVAGLYAVVKAAYLSLYGTAVSVADATAWIAASGSFAATYSLPAPTGMQSYRRIRVPAL